MPMIRGGDADGVDIITGDNFAVIVVRLAVLVLVTLVGGIAGGVAAGGVTVGNGHANDVFVAHEPSLQAPVLDAHTDETDRNLVIRFNLGR